MPTAHPLKMLSTCLQSLYEALWIAKDGHINELFASPLSDLQVDIEQTDTSCTQTFLHALCDFLETNEDVIFDALGKIADGPATYTRFMAKANYLEESMHFDNREPVTLEVLYVRLAHEDAIYFRCACKKALVGHDESHEKDVNRVIMRPELCKQLGIDSSTLNNSWFNKGFPKPVSPEGARPQKFLVTQVNDWLRSQGKDQLPQ